MKTVLIGNAGAGKSALASQLLKYEQAVRLSLDELAFSEGRNVALFKKAWPKH